MSIHERIERMLNEKKLKVADIARATKVSPVAARKWVIGESVPTAKNLKIIANYLGVSDDWILTGKEPKQNQGDIRFAPIEFRSVDAKDQPNNVQIPIYRDVKASCGAGIENFLEDACEYLNIDPQILKLMGIETNPKNLKIIYSAEYSMYPTVAPDSPLFVDVSDRDPNALKNGNVYVFTHNHELRMKRIFVSYGSQTVKLTSDNPDKNRYPDEFISNEQLHEINFVGRLELALVKP